MTSLAQRVIHILTSPAATRISFRFPDRPIAVDGTTFARVVAAIGTGRIRVEQAVHLPAGAAARFRRGVSPPRLQVSNSISPRHGGDAVVHESVHASMFLTGSLAYITDVENEAAAYIAGELYRRYINIFQSRGRTGIDNVMFAAAADIALTIAMGRPIGQGEIDTLRTVIGMNPLYPGIAR